MMKKIKPSTQSIAVRDELIALMRAKMTTMDTAEILAVVAYTVGQLIALQDQRKITPARALALVSYNIEAGNADAIAEAFKGAKPT